MILGKLLKVNPLDLCSKLEKILLNDIKDFKKIDIVKPGFINISLDDKAIEKFIKHVFINQEKYGSFEDNKKYNIEFVSANPTGPYMLDIVEERFLEMCCVICFYLMAIKSLKNII